MAKKRAYAWWMGGWVVVWSLRKGKNRPQMGIDKDLKHFRAGSKNMCENMESWALKNNYHILNLKADKQGNLRVWV